MMPDDQSDDFQIPKEQLKRSRRQELRRKVVQGSAMFNGGKVKDAPEPDRYLFIYRVDKNTDQKDLRKYISQNGFSVCGLECISRPESKFLSFKLTVPLSQFKRLFDPSLWPEGFRIRKFVPSRRDNDNQTNKNQT